MVVNDKKYSVIWEYYKICFYLMISANDAIGICVEPSVLTLQLIIDYGKMRNWDQMVIFDESSKGKYQKK